MNAPLPAVAKVSIPSLTVSEPELIAVLQSSIYPGAAPESIKLVIGYCKAGQLDPLQKPVHIVPMDVKTGKDSDGKPIYGKRDVIMPGIGLYRVQAARTGEYVGVDDPEFGPMVKLSFRAERWVDGQGGGRREKQTYDDAIEYPEWCKVTVHRLIDGKAQPFSAIEYWVENYATASSYSKAPNAMWKRRPRGQIAKCAEAQALRKAFPEVGAQPTADEMEGKTYEAVDTPAPPEPPHLPGPTSTRAEPPAQPMAQPAATAAAAAAAGVSQVQDGPLAQNKKRILLARMESGQVTDEQIEKQFGKPLDQLLDSQFNAVQAWIREMVEAKG